MGDKQHIIELNGKRYDAVTGKIIAPEPLKNPAKAAVAAIKRVGTDGFARATTAAGRRPQKSKTLMRKTVSKPSASKTLSEAAADAKHPHHVEQSHTAAPAHTLAKAKAVPKSAMVRRFSDMGPTQPLKAAATTHTPQQTARVQAVATAKPVAENAISRGLASATSHEQPKFKRPRAHVRAASRLHISPRVLSTGSLILAGLLIGGFFAYQNLPNLNMRLAATRSGVHGALPGYKPAGFSLRGGISYQPGQISFGYKSNSDDRNFKVSQSTSTWNSETLAQNYDALKNNSSYLAVPNKGKTVYIYGGSNATWVDGGIWYRIEGDSKLNSDQLLSLANSM